MANGHKPLKPVRTRKDGKPDKRYVENPLAKVCRQKLEQLRNERLTFTLVGDPTRCTKGCWQQRQCQVADHRAFRAYGDKLQDAQFPMLSLASTDEVTENFRGYLLRCPCLDEVDEQSDEGKD